MMSATMIQNNAACQAILEKQVRRPSASLRCLLPLLEAVGYQGNIETLLEAFPYFSDSIDLNGLLQIMSLLGYQHVTQSVRLNQLEPALLPALFLKECSDQCLLLLEADQSYFHFYNPETKTHERMHRSESVTGVIYTFSKEPQQAPSKNYFQRFLSKNKLIYATAFLLSVIVGLFSMVLPLFVLLVYDKVLTSHSLSTLVFIGIGAAIAMAGAYHLQKIRSKMLAFLSAHIDEYVGSAIINKLLGLPLTYIENAKTNDQIARIKDFDRSRTNLINLMNQIVFELPLLAMLVIALYYIGGALILVPGIACLTLTLVLLGSHRWQAELSDKASQQGKQKQGFLFDILSNRRILQSLMSKKQMVDHYSELLAESIRTRYRVSSNQFMIEAIYDVVMALSGLAVLVIGASMAMKQQLGMGALIVSMVLTWRILFPLRSIFLMFSQINQIRSSLNQIDELMKLQTEQQESDQLRQLETLRGSIRFAELSMRYLGQVEPALVGISFSIQPQQLTVITGRGGSGKSTLLKLMVGLYGFQAGKLFIDDIDIRQLDLASLRSHIAYVPQQQQFFYGTVEQNLRLATPLASPKQLQVALEQAGLWQEVCALAEGLQTVMGDQKGNQFSVSFLQRLALARAYLQDAAVCLFDEVYDGFDSLDDKCLMQQLQRLKQHKAVVLVSQRPSHMKMADQLIVMERGKVVGAGKPEEFLSSH